MRNYENRWVPTRSSLFCIVHSGRGRWEEDTLHSFTMTKESLRPGCLSNASMRETNIISDTGGADRMKRSQQWMDYRVFFFFFRGREGERAQSSFSDFRWRLLIVYNGKVSQSTADTHPRMLSKCSGGNVGQTDWLFYSSPFFYKKNCVVLWVSPQIKRHRLAELWTHSVSVYLLIRVLMKHIPCNLIGTWDALIVSSRLATRGDYCTVCVW